MRAMPATGTDQQGVSFNKLCDNLNKSVPYVRNIMRSFSLPYLPSGKLYSPMYESFLRKLISLKALAVSDEKITEVLDLEKKILKLLHLDTISDSPTWYLDSCSDTICYTKAETCLLLTGHDVGFSLQNGAVQHRLNFGESDKELFSGKEMGEDLLLIMERYRERVENLHEKVRQEAKVLENSLNWVNLNFGS
jgi:hypothetical protein